MEMFGRRKGFRAWLVEPYRQIKLGLIFLFLNLVFAGLFFAIFGYYFWDVYQILVEYFRLGSEEQNQLIAKFYPPMFLSSGLLLLFIILSIFTSIMYTHRIYGPLVSIHRFLDDLLEGRQVEPILLRRSDELKELVAKLNQLNRQIDRMERKTS